MTLPDLVQIRALAKKKDDENWDFRQFLKIQDRLSSSQVDQKVSEKTERIWAGIDCTTCANCCEELKPTFSDEDVSRISQRLGITSEQLVTTYLNRIETGENPYQTRTTPCPFLENKRCTIYEDRPAECRGYPYLYEPDFIFRTIGMIERTHTCPIVFELFEELKRSMGFLRPKRRR